MYEIGLSTVGGKLFPSREEVDIINEEFLENCQKAGIKHIEPSLYTEQYYKLDYKALTKIAGKHGVNVWSLHLPYGPTEGIELSSSDKEIRKSTRSILSELIKKAGDAGINKYIVHSSYVFEREVVGEKGLRERLDNTKENLAYFAEVAERAGGVMAVENLPPSCLPTNYEEHLDLLSADSRLRACFDTNHMVGGDPAEHIRALGDKLITMHVSDYDLEWEKHWFPGEGKNDWNPIVDALSDIDYKGIWLYEVSFSSPTSKYVHAHQKLTCDDFVRNAKEILNKEKITVVRK